MGACECVEVKHGEAPVGPFPAVRALTKSNTVTLLPGSSDRPQAGGKQLLLPIAKREVPVIEEADLLQVESDTVSRPRPLKTSSGRILPFSEAEDEVYVHNDWEDFRFKALKELNARRQRRNQGGA